jgi:hypothetical protein
MKKVISSGMTVVFKIIFPVVWIGMFAFGTVALFQTGQPAKWAFLAVLVAGSAFLLWCCVPLKRIELDGRALRISNFVKTIVVDVGDINRISENTIINIHPVWLHFRSPTAFGNKVMFMPHTQWSPLTMFRSHPIVDELWKLREDSQPTSRGDSSTRADAGLGTPQK